ncbi:hypothetical protein ACQ4PT_045379 [Festuca glaucescens]
MRWCPSRFTYLMLPTPLCSMELLILARLSIKSRNAARSTEPTRIASMLRQLERSYRVEEISCSVVRTSTPAEAVLLCMARRGLLWIALDCSPIQVVQPGEDRRLLCESLPTYGTGQEAGDEANYIVGMSTCYPKPGSIKVSDGEVLTVVSNYSSDRQHTGVMGLFYILVSEPQQPAPAPSLCFSFPAKWCLPAWISSNM